MDDTSALPWMAGSGGVGTGGTPVLHGRWTLRALRVGYGCLFGDFADDTFSANSLRIFAWSCKALHCADKERIALCMGLRLVAPCPSKSGLECIKSCIIRSLQKWAHGQLAFDHIGAEAPGLIKDCRSQCSHSMSNHLLLVAHSMDNMIDGILTHVRLTSSSHRPLFRHRQKHRYFSVSVTLWQISSQPDLRFKALTYDIVRGVKKEAYYSGRKPQRHVQRVFSEPAIAGL